MQANEGGGGEISVHAFRWGGAQNFRTQRFEGSPEASTWKILVPLQNFATAHRVDHIQCSTATFANVPKGASKNTYVFLKSEQCSDLGGWVGCVNLAVQISEKSEYK